MHYKNWLVLLLLSAMAMFVPQSLAAADHPAGNPILGTYIVAGWNPGKDTAQPPDYKGEMTVAAPATGSMLEVVWRTGGPAVAGSGLLRKIGETWVLSVSFVIQNHVGTAVYEVQQKGSEIILAGLWGAPGTDLGFEVNRKPAPSI